MLLRAVRQERALASCQRASKEQSPKLTPARSASLPPRCAARNGRRCRAHGAPLPRRGAAGVARVRGALRRRRRCRRRRCRALPRLSAHPHGAAHARLRGSCRFPAGAGRGHRVRAHERRAQAFAHALARCACVTAERRFPRRLSLQVEVLEYVPRKPLVLMTWQGSDAALPSILLNSHTDVVPAEASFWRRACASACMHVVCALCVRALTHTRCVQPRAFCGGAGLRRPHLRARLAGHEVRRHAVPGGPAPPEGQGAERRTASQHTSEQTPCADSFIVSRRGLRRCARWRSPSCRTRRSAAAPAWAPSLPRRALPRCAWAWSWTKGGQRPPTFSRSSSRSAAPGGSPSAPRASRATAASCTTAARWSGCRARWRASSPSAPRSLTASRHVRVCACAR
jgi:hypothetical protein